jgi:hypothetical protein
MGLRAHSTAYTNRGAFDWVLRGPGDLSLKNHGGWVDVDQARSVREDQHAVLREQALVIRIKH